MKTKVGRIDITADLTEKGREELKVGAILRFETADGVTTELKIVSKRRGKVWAVPTTTYTQNEVAIVDKD